MQVVACADCGFLQTSGYPVDLVNQKRLNESLQLSFEVSRKRAAQKIDAVMKLLETKRYTDRAQIQLVELGAGNDHFAQAAASAGLSEVITFEPYASKDMTNKVSANDWQSLVRLVQKVSPTKKIVFCGFHVLEHIPKPDEFLTLLHHLMPLDSLAIFEVPVMDLEPLIRIDPSPFWVPFHASHFTIETFTYLLQKARFQVEEYLFFDDYNGAMFLASKPSKNFLFEDKSKLTVEKALSRSDNLSDQVRQAQNRGGELISRILSKSIKNADALLLWGAGLGEGFFRSKFRAVLDNVITVTCDSNPARQNFQTLSPRNALLMCEKEHLNGHVVMVPTAYAKSEEIVEQCKALVEELRPQLDISYFLWPDKRAY